MSSEQMNTDRRRWERLPICVPMFVHWSSDQGRELNEFATALNISAGGALLAMHRCAPIGTKVRIEIPCAPVINNVQPGKAVNHFYAEVVRIETSGTTHVVGAQFVPPVTSITLSEMEKASLPT